MKDSELTVTFAAAEVGEEPALPPESVERTLTRARRSRRRWRGVGAAVALAVLAVVALLPWPGRGPDASPPGPPGQPTFPAQFADYSSFTSRAAARPAGRAIALYDYGSFDQFVTWQTLVVGADRDTYRRVDINEANLYPDRKALLSPDGTQLLYYRPSQGTDDFVLLDLSTGRSSVRHSVEWISDIGAGLNMLAWSPDGRYVAYAVPAVRPVERTAAYQDGLPIRQLAILDVTNDTTARYPDISPLYQAAFAPDSTQLAVMSGVDSMVVSVHGQRLTSWTPPPGVSPQSGLAWSPDGAMLAMVISPTMRSDCSTVRDAGIRFLDMTGTGRPVPSDVPCGTVLGWRSPTSLIVQYWLPDEDVDALVEMSTVDGSWTVLSRFSGAKECEYGLERCHVLRIQLATNLIGSAGIRASDPDRGPWVPIVHIGTVVLVVAVAGAWWIVRRRRRSRGDSHQMATAG